MFACLKKVLLASSYLSVPLSACINLAALGRFSCDWVLETFIKISRKSIFGCNQTEISGTSCKDLSMFIVLTAVENILYLNGVKRICCYISMATHNTVDSRMWLNNTKGIHYFTFMAVLFISFILLTVAYLSQQYTKCTTVFPWQR